MLHRKPDGAWSLPGNWPVREAEVHALVDLLAGLRSRFEPQPLHGEKELAELGLDSPAVTVKLTVDGEDHILAFGEKRQDDSENRFSRDTYLRLDKKKEAVRLAPGWLLRSISRRDYYQQRRLFQGERVVKEGSDSDKTERLAAQSLSVADNKPEGLHFTLRRDGSDWELAEPVRDRVDAATRDSLLSALPTSGPSRSCLAARRHSRLAGILRPISDVCLAATDIFFATQGGLLVRASLIEPERTVTVKYANGDTVRLQIGGISGRRNKLVPAPQQQECHPVCSSNA